MGHRIIISFLLAFNCLYYVHAQDFWEELNTPGGIHIYSIAVNDAGQIFLGAANDGAPAGVYRSDDLGDTWDLVFDNGELQVSPVEICWYQDVFIGKRGFEQLMVSHDLGDTWDSLFFPVLNSIAEIFSPGLDTLFVSYADGGARLLRTYDNTMTWDTVFITTNSTEYIKDILQTQSGDMYIALTGYFPDMGGVYKSTDGGNSWELSGLFNYMVSSLDENSEGDVFAGARGILQSGLWPGLYVLRNGEDEWEGLLGGPSIEDVIVNSADHIYASSSQVIRSLDNGQSFEYFEEGLFPGPKGDMTKDELDYLYVTSEFSSNALYRTINTTVLITEEYQRPPAPSLILYPNPVREQLFLKMISDENDFNNIRVYNSLGVLVLQTKEETGSNNIMLDVAPLLPGFYFVEANTENTKQTGRFIKY